MARAPRFEQASSGQCDSTSCVAIPRALKSPPDSSLAIPMASKSLRCLHLSKLLPRRAVSNQQYATQASSSEAGTTSPAQNASPIKPSAPTQSPPTPSEHAYHRSPAIAARRAKQWPPSDAPIPWIFFGSLIGVPTLVYYWYHHRKEHMHNKKQQLLKEAQERYKAGLSR
jgi:hypothetical protein